MRDTIEMAQEAQISDTTIEFYQQELKVLVALVRADEREAIKDEWWMCVQSDLENGVKSLNEQAAIKWRAERTRRNQMREKKLYWDVHPNGRMTRKLVEDWDEEEKALFEREQAFVREATALGYVLRLNVDTQKWTVFYEGSKTLEALIRADERSIEREACAKEADKWSKRDDDVGAFIGKAIRARGEN